MACPVPTGASAATCDGTRCEFNCRTGFHRCGARCAADNDATACGAACTACPIDPNGTAICQTDTCDLMCKTGFHKCGNKCVDNSATANCGPSSCTACVAPSGGTATCNGVACGSTCPSGQRLCAGACIPSAQACAGVCPAGNHNCSGVCLPNNNISSCGTRCTGCPGPTSNGSATCDGTSCGIACATGFKNCPGTSTCVANGACCVACSGTTPLCQNGACVKRPLGQLCDLGTECSSGVCADGVCCGTSCTGQCEACNSAANAGNCVAVTTPRTPCAGGAAACGGKCDGTEPDRCIYPGASTTCRTQSCTSGTKTAAATCNSAGACASSVTTTCPGGCNSAGTDCQPTACQNNPPPCTPGLPLSCGCGLTQACSSACVLGPCQGTAAAGCCPDGLNDHWNAYQVGATTRPWSIFRGAPDTVDIDDRLVLFLNDRVARVLPSRGYVATVAVLFNEMANNTFAFDFGDTNSSRLFPAIRVVQNQVNPILQVGGARPPVSPATRGVWGAFGNLTSTQGTPLALRAIMTVYVKSNAVALKVVIGADTYKSGFVTMNPRALHLVHYATSAEPTSGVVTLEPISGCQDLPDLAVDSRYETDPN